MDRKNIILDFDQTLISTQPTEDRKLFTKDNKKKMENFKMYNMEDYYIVFERPGLQKFLNYLFENFNVSIWTAASKDYALFILDKIIIGGHTNRKIDYFLFSYHRDISKNLSETGGTKDLNILWDHLGFEGYSKDNTIIIDDYDDVYNVQKNNCIFIPPFEFFDDNSENDTVLLTIKEQLETLKQNNVDKIVNDINETLKF
jgi:TFIIF-interacting CTD phosphatase-like protein